ncbi:acyltransferase [Bacillus albus]|uniref:acyltransferase family protein n=1 Tax=Bacillus TaxID=1386 RepID=UPI00141A3E81|nr:MULTISPECIES: acyltransferase [Bacillus]MBU5216028.1 acyltransferase [Bacillus albus]MDA2025273.1 acyltransferase [Bacillus cereus group sp. Bcc03]MDA2259341.1 acyltransferase [Bacillus cereus group sp. Bc200]MDA2320666.1 acyltransferase [Bacillus cereus group sp. Bc177]MDA2712291.1 acyltransferase [Bacillus cereus group sp. Bc025]
MNRYEELDSIRGISSLVVMIGHHLMIFSVFQNYSYEDNKPFVMYLLKETPARLIFSSGNESVIIFFVLSGFVLYRSIQNNYDSYGSFLLKRICRIYIPYIVAILIAILCQTTMSEYGISHLSEWFNRSWTIESSLSLIVQHILLVGKYNTDAYNGVIWSLVHEMRISMIFPLVLMVCLRKTLRGSLLSLFSFSICSVLILLLFHSSLTLTSYALTLHYTVLFLLGALVAKYKENVIVFYSNRTKNEKIAWFLFAILLYMYEGLIGEIKLLNNFIFRDYVIAISACLFVILSLSVSTLSSLLRNKYLLYLGKISYSLYLYHIISLFSLIYMLHEILPLPIILIFSLVFSFILAMLSYIFVEKFAFRVGKYVTKQANRKKKGLSVKNDLQNMNQTKAVK